MQPIAISNGLRFTLGVTAIAKLFFCRKTTTALMLSIFQSKDLLNIFSLHVLVHYTGRANASRSYSPLKMIIFLLAIFKGNLHL